MCGDGENWHEYCLFTGKILHVSKMINKRIHYSGGAYKKDLEKKALGGVNAFTPGNEWILPFIRE
jgi:hypothetical protein